MILCFAYAITRFGVWRRKRSPEVSNENHAKATLTSSLLLLLFLNPPDKYVVQTALKHQTSLLTAKEHESTSKHFDTDEYKKRQDKCQEMEVSDFNP